MTMAFVKIGWCKPVVLENLKGIPKPFQGRRLVMSDNSQRTDEPYRFEMELNGLRYQVPLGHRTVGGYIGDREPHYIAFQQMAMDLIELQQQFEKKNKKVERQAREINRLLAKKVEAESAANTFRRQRDEFMDMVRELQQALDESTQRMKKVKEVES
nr:hypothetical protein 8 [Pseudomonadaceae bacterium]